MQYKEFTALCKSEANQVTENFYMRLIEPIYMACDMDKETFCAAIDAMHADLRAWNLMLQLRGEMGRLETECQRLHDDLNVMKADKRTMEEYLVTSGQEEHTCLPVREIIKIKLDNQITPSEDEIKYIKSIL